MIESFINKKNGNEIGELLGFGDLSDRLRIWQSQEMAQSERNSHSKNRGGKKPNWQFGTYT